MKKKNEKTQEDYGFSSAEEAFNYLKKRGYDVQWNNVPMLHYEDTIPAGKPNGIGDVTADLVMVPKYLIDLGAQYTVNVKGDSMKDADIDSGDLLAVKNCPIPEEGDMVVAALDGELTVKNFHRSDRGDYILVPRNHDYEPIDMKEFAESKIIGKVMAIVKPVRCTPTRELRKYLGTIEEELLPPPTDNLVKMGIQIVNLKMKKLRHWYPVYRSLVDANVIEKGDYEGFIEYVNGLFPDNDFSITKDALQRMAVGSFDKPVKKWKDETAPVHGSTFLFYKEIAVTMLKTMGRF
ncbi:MAG: hypothetical protein K6C10_06730 [Prevotella sp.]|nr:hypothetical protein [Prevotella sp.]